MRLPAEWEKQGFVQLTWPHEDTAWYALPQVLDCYVAVAKAITRYEPLLVVCRDKAECLSDMAARGWEPTANVRFVECPLNDTWARDHGAISVWGNEGEKCIEDFVFNGWGLKFGADLDNQITRTIYKKGAFAADVRYLDMRPFVLEGGSIDTDGAGTLMATSECLCSLNRNEYLSRQEIEEKLKQAFGLQRILWLDHGGIPHAGRQALQAHSPAPSGAAVSGRLPPAGFLCQLPDCERRRAHAGGRFPAGRKSGRAAPTSLPGPHRRNH